MTEQNVQELVISAADGKSLQLHYDQDSDILEIFFGPNNPATGIELTEHILLRINLKIQQAQSLTIRHFSILTQKTEYGPRSYALPSVDEMPDSLRELVLHILTTPPVNQFLKLSHFQGSKASPTLFAYVASQPIATAA